MNTSILRFCISLAVALVLSMGQGYAAAESLLMSLCQPANQAIMHACCQKNIQQEHKGVSTKDIKAHGCHCVPLAQDDRGVASTVSPNDLPLDMAVAVSRPEIDLKVADATLPVWLYKLYHPDKSNLYLENRRLLL